MRKDLSLHTFKIKLTQEPKPLDHLKRRNFYNWALAKLEENEEFHRKIIFSEEAHFWLNGFVNKQNMRYWSATNPNVLLETPTREIANVLVEIWTQYLKYFYVLFIDKIVMSLFENPLIINSEFFVWFLLTFWRLPGYTVFIMHLYLLLQILEKHYTIT